LSHKLFVHPFGVLLFCHLCISYVSDKCITHRRSFPAFSRHCAGTNDGRGSVQKHREKSGTSTNFYWTARQPRQCAPGQQGRHTDKASVNS